MRQHVKGSASVHLPIPGDIHVGAVIGVGACQVKQIQTKYGVRCQIDNKKREAVVTGPRSAIDSAVDGLQDLFHRLRLERLQFLDKQRYQRNTRTVETRNRVYRIAALTSSTHGSWMFQRLPDVERFGERFENRLIHLESFNDDPDIATHEVEASEHLTGKWIEKFGAPFQQRMIQDVKQLAMKGDPSTGVKIKAALGFTSYALPDANTACRLYSWEQLQDLKLHQDFQRRWENTCNRRSELVAAMMHALETRIPPDASYETALTINVGSDEAGNRDLSLKFLWMDEQWTEVSERAPIREPHGLYNISLDDETAFRLRVYSREYLSANHEPQVSDLVRAFELTTHPSGDPLRTEVTLRATLPSGMFVRSIWLREKTKVDYRGLHFSISYSSAAHTDAMVQCQSIPTSATTESEVKQSADTLRDLVDAMLSVLTHP